MKTGLSKQDWPDTKKFLTELAEIIISVTVGAILVSIFLGGLKSIGT